MPTPRLVARLLGRPTEGSPLNVRTDEEPTVEAGRARPSRRAALWRRVWTRLTSEQAYNQWVEGTERDSDTRKVRWRWISRL